MVLRKDVHQLKNNSTRLDEQVKKIRNESYLLDKEVTEINHQSTYLKQDVVDIYRDVRVLNTGWWDTSIVKVNAEKGGTKLGIWQGDCENDDECVANLINIK